MLSFFPVTNITLKITKQIMLGKKQDFKGTCTLTDIEHS